MEAASGGYAEVGRVLLDKGADVNAPPVPSSRDTALTIAADKGHYKFCELLISRYAVCNCKAERKNKAVFRLHFPNTQQYFQIRSKGLGNGKGSVLTFTT